MKSSILLLGLLLVSCPIDVSAQTSERTKKELPCECEIHDVVSKCGRCGGFLTAKMLKSLPNNYYAFSYDCQDCPHNHIGLSNQFDYGHVCNEERCLKRSATTDANGNRTLHFKNVCPKGIPFIVWILPRSRHLRSLIVPDSEWNPNVTFPKEERIRIEIDTRSR